MKLKPHEVFTVWRKRNNFSQDEIAERFNVSQGYISHMEMGIRPVPKKIREAMPKKMRVKPGDEFQARIRRQGINMLLAVKMFKKSHQILLQYIRNEIPVPQEIWDRLDHDEKKYAEYKAKKEAERAAS